MKMNKTKKPKKNKKTNKILKNQKGGLILQNIKNWKCNNVKCENDNEKKSIDFYNKIYEHVYLFFKKNMENIDNREFLDFNRALYTDTYKEFESSDESSSCLEYYKLNSDEELQNLQKLLLSIKLECYVDYLYTNFNNIIIFLPLIDIFYNKFSNDTKTKDKFKELYLNLRNKKNITFKEIDYLLEIFIHILNLRINALTKSVITFITLINTILQLFREILNHKDSEKQLSIISLSQHYFNNIIFEKIKEIIDIDEYLNIEKIKEYLGEEIFEQLTVLIEDYNKYFSDQENPIDIQKYLKLKINEFMKKFTYINFGILPIILKINKSNTSMAGGATSVKSSIKSKASSLYKSVKSSVSSLSKKLSSPNYEKLSSTNADTNIFNSKVTWNNFKSFMKNDKDQHTIFDVINNKNNDYHILNLILGSISIKTNINDDEIKLIKYFNELIYMPHYGKICGINVDNIQNNNQIQYIDNQNNESQLISSENTKPIKLFTSKGVESDFSTKVVKRLDLGLDDICIALNQELILSKGSLSAYNNFIRKIFTLDFKITKYNFIKSRIKKKILLLFLNKIMKINIDEYIKLQVNEFILQINEPTFLSIFKSLYLSKPINYEGIEDLLKKDKEIYEEIHKEIIEFIKKSFEEKKSFEKYDNDLKTMFINYFIYYYNRLLELLDKFINNDANIDTGKDIKSIYNDNDNKYLLSEHKLDNNIFIYLFRYTIPISSELIEDFIQFEIINGYNGFNYLQYNSNKKFIESYITNEKYHKTKSQEKLTKRIMNISSRSISKKYTTEINV